MPLNMIIHSLNVGLPTKELFFGKEVITDLRNGCLNLLKELRTVQEYIEYALKSWKIS